jgi:DNA-binding CsgD family transcriptional regulator
MRGEPALLNTVTQLYAATLARDDWGAVLEQVRDAFAGHHVLLAMHDFGSGAVPFAASVGIDDEDRARFLSTDAVRRSAPIYSAFPLDTALPRNAFISDRDFARSDFYDEFVRPMQGFHSVGAVLRGPDQLTASINICRPERAGAYDLPDATALQLILPHVAMALEIQARMKAASLRSHSLEQLVDCFAVAALVCDSSGRPCFMNARAQSLFAAGDGLSLSPTGLAAATPTGTRELRTAIVRVAAGTGLCGPAAIRLKLPRPSQRPALRVTLSRVWRLESDGAGASGMGVAMLVTEPDAPPPIDKEALADNFHLTQREADVACLLAGGADLNAIATSLDLGLGTVRFHLKHAFQKTGTCSQAALVAVARGFAKPDLS